MDLQKSGLLSAEPYACSSEYTQEPGPAVVGSAPQFQRVKRSGKRATTPAQMTPALISFVTTIERSVMYPPMECPHIPMRLGSASGWRFTEATALSTSME